MGTDERLLEYIKQQIIKYVYFVKEPIIEDLVITLEQLLKAINRHNKESYMSDGTNIWKYSRGEIFFKCEFRLDKEYDVNEICKLLGYDFENIS